MRRILIFGFLVAIGATAQPRFEVVSVKRCTNPSPNGGSVNGVPGRLRLECVSVDSLIRSALITYPDGQPWPRQNGLLTLPILQSEFQQQIKNSSGWIKSDAYTVDAKADSPASMEMMRGPMMQVVLRDRLKLRVHKEPREISVYDLIIAKGGPKLEPAKEGSCYQLTAEKGPPPPLKKGESPHFICGGFAVSSKGGVDARSISIGSLCMHLSMSMDRDVVDKTGIAGLYDIHLDVSMSDIARRPAARASPSDPSAVPEAADPNGTIASALRKVGLQLQPGKHTAQFLVIDHIEKPAAN